MASPSPGPFGVLFVPVASPYPLCLVSDYKLLRPPVSQISFPQWQNLTKGTTRKGTQRGTASMLVLRPPFRKYGLRCLSWVLHNSPPPAGFSRHDLRAFLVRRVQFCPHAQIGVMSAQCLRCRLWSVWVTDWNHVIP
ncbi:hypothetical protein B0H14DRAFT_2739311 [Mycena olivaceomarginata]|nr:hypothetical protein B0H14DRAFT_2739311 [Mycena olivaceomarginata]